MGLTVQHVKTLTQPDSTNPDIVRPTDWNSGHIVSFSQDVVLGGNAAGAATLVADKLYLHGGNNVTLSGNGSTVTVIAAAGGGGAAISAGTQSQSTGTVILSNANGVSFGLDNGTLTGSVRTDYLTTAQPPGAYLTTAAQSDHTHSQYLTTAQPPGAYLTTAAVSNHSHGNPTLNLTNISGTTVSNSAGLTISLSAAPPGAGGGGAAMSAGTQSVSTGTVAFANSHGVSFGMSGSNQITASHNGLTTAALSGHSHNFATTTTNGGQIVVGTANSAGATIGVPPFLTTAQAPGAYLTTARASNDAIGLNTALTANGVSVTANSSGLSINVPAFLTTAAVSNVTTNNMATSERGNYFYTSNNTFANSTHSHGMVTTTTNGSQVTIAGNSGGYTLAVPPFVTAAAGGGDGYNIIGVNGAGTALSTTVQFNNGNNVSFGLNAGTITASASYVNDLTSGRAGTGYTSTTQAGATVGVTNNTSGLSMAWPPFLTTAQAPGAYLTTARASNDAIGLNTALTANGVSVTANSSGLSLNFPAFLTTADLSQNSSKYAGTGTGFTGGAAISATLTHNTQGLSINLSHPAWLTTAALSQNTSNYAGLGTTFAGANITGNMTLNTAGLNLSLSVAAPGAAAENNWFTLGGNVSGNSSASGSTIQLYGGNNITLSGGGNSVISIIGGAGGGGLTCSFMDNLGPLATASGAMGSKLVQNNQVQVFPMKPFQDLFNGNMTLNTMYLEVSCSGSTATLSAAGISTIMRFGLYSMVTTGGTLSLSLINSFGKTYGLAAGASNNSTYWQGQRLISVHSSEWSSQPVLTDNGQYFCGIHWSSVGSSAQTFAMIGGFAGSTAARSGFLGSTTANATWNGAFGPFMGVYGTTTGALPTGINYTQVNRQSASANFVPHIIAHNYTNLTMI
jgi:hypothetical protein